MGERGGIDMWEVPGAVRVRRTRVAREDRVNVESIGLRRPGSIRRVLIVCETRGVMRVLKWYVVMSDLWRGAVEWLRVSK